MLSRLIANTYSYAKFEFSLVVASYTANLAAFLTVRGANVYTSEALH